MRWCVTVCQDDRGAQEGRAITESVGKWLRDTGAKCHAQAEHIRELHAEIARLKEARRKLFDTMQAIAKTLGLDHPDPKKILLAIESLIVKV